SCSGPWHTAAWKPQLARSKAWCARIVLCMNEFAKTSSPLESNQRLRLRALIVPPEHGAWGLLLVPLLTGVACGMSSARVWEVALLVFVAIVLFWLRTPSESL